jgi:hypothetical protein
VGYPAYPPPPLPPPTAQRTNAFSIAAAVSAVLAVPLFFFPGFAVLAVVFGLVGHHRAKTFGGEIMGVVAATVGVLSLIGFAFAAVQAIGEIGKDRVAVARLRVGDCLAERFPRGLVERVPCEKQHEAEVVAVLKDVEILEQVRYPSAYSLVRVASEQCETAFQTYVGESSYHSGRLDMDVAIPREDEWRRGARYAVCFAKSGDAHPLVGSVRTQEPG